MRYFNSLAALLICGATCLAQIQYEFVEELSSETIAIIQFSNLPARVAEVDGLTFTDVGQGIFGLGATYPGTFDTMGFLHSEITADKFTPDGLAGADGFGSEFASMSDNDP